MGQAMAMTSCLMVIGRCERETMQMLSTSWIGCVTATFDPRRRNKNKRTKRAFCCSLDGSTKQNCFSTTGVKIFLKNIFFFKKKVRRSRMDSGHHQIRVSEAISIHHRSLASSEHLQELCIIILLIFLVKSQEKKCPPILNSLLKEFLSQKSLLLIKYTSGSSLVINKVELLYLKKIFIE